MIAAINMLVPAEPDNGAFTVEIGSRLSVVRS
jgi:hypothetical protein